MAAVRMALRRAGLDPTRYAGYSFRIGAATSAGDPGLAHQDAGTLGERSLHSVCQDIPGDTEWGCQNASRG